MKPTRPAAALGLALALAAGTAEARVVRVSIERREPVLAGRPFGLAGAYETLVGTVEFALDPALPQNQGIVDLELAPRNAQDEVLFSADLYVLKPKDLARGNGRVYYEVPNRGGKGILRRLQYARSSLDPREEADFGDGWLMEQGFSLVWMGWQWDVPELRGLLRLRAPIATLGGRPITGLVRSVVLVDERKPLAPLGDRGHAAYPPVDPEGPDSRLYARNPNDFRPALRALVRALDEWLARAVPPPASRYPRISDGTLEPPERAGFPALAGTSLPLVRNEPARMDFGPESAKGILTIEPPRLGHVYPALVPAVDQDGNDRAGIRLPEIAVPLATQTGWNPRHPRTGAPFALAGVVGSYLPFARTKARREAALDPRLSLEERYPDRASYLGRIAEAALALTRERLLLPQDVVFVVDRAAAHWDLRAEADR